MTSVCLSSNTTHFIYIVVIGVYLYFALKLWLLIIRYVVICVLFVILFILNGFEKIIKYFRWGLCITTPKLIVIFQANYN